MTQFSYISALLLLCGMTAGAADDETRYRAKSYAGKNLDDKGYSAKTYRSENSAQHKPYSSSKSKSGGFWSFFGLGKSEEHKTITDQETAKGKEFIKDSDNSLAVKRSQTERLSGQQELVVSEEPEGKAFKPSDKKPGRDPMLEPRQGIKVPLADKEGGE